MRYKACHPVDHVRIHISNSDSHGSHLLDYQTYPVLLLSQLVVGGEQLGLGLSSLELEHGDAVDELGHVACLVIMILVWFWSRGFVLFWSASDLQLCSMMRA